MTKLQFDSTKIAAAARRFSIPYPWLPPTDLPLTQAAMANLKTRAQAKEEGCRQLTSQYGATQHWMIENVLKDHPKGVLVEATEGHEVWVPKGGQ